MKEENREQVIEHLAMIDYYISHRIQNKNDHDNINLACEYINAEIDMLIEQLGITKMELYKAVKDIKHHGS